MGTETAWIRVRALEEREEHTGRTSRPMPSAGIIPIVSFVAAFRAAALAIFRCLLACSVNCCCWSRVKCWRKFPVRLYSGRSLRVVDKIKQTT